MLEKKKNDLEEFLQKLQSLTEVANEEENLKEEGKALILDNVHEFLNAILESERPPCADHPSVDDLSKVLWAKYWAIMTSVLGKTFKDLDLPILGREAKEWAKTAGVTPVKILPEREAQAKNDKRKQIAVRILESYGQCP